MGKLDSYLVATAGIGIMLFVVLLAVFGAVDMDDTQQQLPIAPVEVDWETWRKEPTP